jgi:hypothetical protein
MTSIRSSTGGNDLSAARTAAGRTRGRERRTGSLGLADGDVGRVHSVLAENGLDFVGVDVSERDSVGEVDLKGE